MTRNTQSPNPLRCLFRGHFKMCNVGTIQEARMEEDEGKAPPELQGPAQVAGSSSSDSHDRQEPLVCCFRWFVHRLRLGDARFGHRPLQPASEKHFRNALLS